MMIGTATDSAIRRQIRKTIDLCEEEARQEAWLDDVRADLQKIGIEIDNELHNRYANSAAPNGRGPLVILTTGHAVWEDESAEYGLTISPFDPSQVQP
jgi:hypothetical protein